MLLLYKLRMGPLGAREGGTHMKKKKQHGSYTATIYLSYLNWPELPYVFHARPIHVLFKIRPIMAPLY